MSTIASVSPASSGKTVSTKPVTAISNGFSSRSFVSIDSVVNRRPVSGSAVGESVGSIVIVSSIGEPPTGICSSVGVPSTSGTPSAVIVNPSPSTSVTVTSSVSSPMFCDE